MQEIVNHHCFWAYGLGAVNRVLQNRVNPLPASRIRLRGRNPSLEMAGSSPAMTVEA
jgi:hypothetical protein